MSTEKTPARPRQVTTAVALGVVGSALVVLSLFDALQRLRTVEMRQAVEEFLAEPPGDGLGVSTGWVLDALHVMILFNGALAAVTAVTAVYVFQRHHAARIAFSIAAGLLLLTSPFSGGVMAMLVAFAATMLWSRPARDWFAGREPLPAAAPAGEPARAQRPDPWAAPAPPAPVRSSEEKPSEPESTPGADRPGPASYPFGRPPENNWTRLPYEPPPVAPGPVGGTAAYDQRPGGVTAAAVLTWVFSGGTALVYLVIVVMLMFARGPLVDALQQDPRFDDLGMAAPDLLAVLWVMSAISIFWCVSAFALAVLAFRRVAWARIALVVSAAVTALFGLLTFPIGLVHAAAAVATIWLLFSRGANQWFSRKTGTVELPGPADPADAVDAAGPAAGRQQATGLVTALRR